MSFGFLFRWMLSVDVTEGTNLIIYFDAHLETFFLLSYCDVDHILLNNLPSSRRFVGRKIGIFEYPT